MNAQTWEAPLTNAKGIFGPAPWRMGSWDAAGNLVSCRDMTKREELEQLFPATRFDTSGFRQWLGRVNPDALRRLDLWAAEWEQ